MTERGKRSNPARVALLIGGIFLWSIIILTRLALLQVFQHDEFAQQALQHQLMTKAVLAPRGIIYDAHMDELATSVTVNMVVAEPRRIKDVPAAARGLAAILNLDPGELLAKMKDPARRTFMVIQHRINPQDEGRIESLGIDGIYLMEESMRVYPNRELGAQTLGFVNMNGDGGAGIEQYYDRELKGTQGQISFAVDARRRAFRAKVEQRPVQGHSLVLSMDKDIQYITERELAAGVEGSRAAGGIAVVMETATGRILALAGYPAFNCNTYNEYALGRHRNRAVSDIFEPGSTFKVVVAAAALDAGLTRPSESIDCLMGAITIAGHVFHDHHPYGLLTFNEILEKSSNVGAARLGLRLGRERLYEALHTFGFGAKTGLDLPAEVGGLVRDWKQWSGLSIGAISFGQEVGVTSIQILCAINAIANGGYRVRPSVVDRIIDENGELVQPTAPNITRIIRPETAAVVRDAFEGVVLRGTGRQAALDGYRAAGKTGTAQKIVYGRYSDTKYVASFIGFAPLPQPKITVLVQIDEPEGVIYGGEVSAPIFRKITQEALLKLHVPPDQTLPAPARLVEPAIAADSEDFRPNATPILPMASNVAAGEDKVGDGTVTMFSDRASVVVPDFTGMSKRKVIERCQEMGLEVQTFGVGSAVQQLPPAGTTVSIGDTCRVTFAVGQPGASNKPTAAGRSVARPAGQHVTVSRH
jgi:cell division protein FtsI (penicillin-binding protein 3)